MSEKLSLGAFSISEWFRMLTTMTGKERRKVMAISAGIAGVAYFLYKTYKNSKLQRFKKVPGLPWFIGIGLEIEGGKNLIRVLEKYAAEYGDEGVFEVDVFGDRQVIACGWEAVRATLEPRPIKVRRLKLMDNYKYFFDGVFNAEGAAWRHQRFLTAPAFHPKALEDYLPGTATVLRQAGEEAIEAFSVPDGNVNISKLIKRSTWAVLIKAITGNDFFKSELIPNMADQVDRFFEVLVPGFVMPPFWKIPIIGEWTALKQEGDKMLNMMKDLQQKTGDDPEGKFLITKIRQAHEGQKLTESELVGVVSNLFVAGSDTTTTAITWCFYELSKRPDIQERVAAEVAAVAPDGVKTTEQVKKLKLARAVFKETLRMYSATPLLGSTTLTEMELCGRTVPPDTTILTLQRFAYNNAPDTKKILGEDLHVWNPDRWLDSNGDVKEFQPIDMLQFGYGARICLGNFFAQQTGTVTISSLCRCVELEPCQDEPKEIFFVLNGIDRDIVLKGKKRVMK